jgi:TRAP-type C4-dicarboxylate transport system permease small subunit
MRKFLDYLYRASGALGATFLGAICITVMLQVCANMIDSLVRLVTGEPFGLLIPSYSEFTGFFLVAASFLSLAYSLRAGSHIRVSLIIRGVSGKPRRLVELWCTGSGAIFVAYFAWHSILMVMDSYEFNDISYGMIPVPIWIPQLGMALGLVILTVALIDDMVSVLKGETPSYEIADGTVADEL